MLFRSWQSRHALTNQNWVWTRVSFQESSLWRNDKQKLNSTININFLMRNRRPMLSMSRGLTALTALTQECQRFV